MSDTLEGLSENEVVAPIETSASTETSHVETQATPPQPPNVLSLAEQRGYRFKDENEVLDAIDRLAQELQANAPYADFGKNAVPQWNEFEEFRKSREAEKARSQAPAQPQSAWAPPQLSPIELDTYFKKDPSTGRYTANPGIPPEVARKAAEWDAYTGRHIYNFRTNPIESLKNLGYAQKDEILSEVKNYFKQEREREQQEYVKTRTLEEIRPLITDKATGRLNAYGLRFTEVVNELEANGMRDVQAVAAYARRIVDGELGVRQAQSQANDAAIRQNSGMPLNPGGPAAQNQPVRQPPAVRADAPAPANMSLQQLLRQVDPNFDFNAMKKDLLGF